MEGDSNGANDIIPAFSAMVRNIGFFLIPEFHLLDLAGALSAFHEVDSHHPGAYRLHVFSPKGGMVRSQEGLAVETAPAPVTAFHTLVIVGGRGPRLAASSVECVAMADALASRSYRIATVCTGAFLLAATGRLDGRRVTTHWRYSADFQRLHPSVKVDADCIYIGDGPYWTSGGITAGIDLAMALIEADLGSEIARKVARELVVHSRRLGGQAQFSESLRLEPETDRMRRAWAFARENLDQPLSVEQLAGVAALSPRQFGRAFRAETGTPPAKAVERLRVEAARTRLESGSETLECIAAAAGFSGTEQMRRAFLRMLGRSPQTIKREARARRTYREPQGQGA